jgi:PEP-CTERM motif
MMRRLILAFGMALLFAGGRPVSADPITLVAAGTVTHAFRAERVTGSPVEVNDRFAFSFTMDPAASATLVQPNFAAYPLGPGGYALSVGRFHTSQSYETADLAQMWVIDHSGQPPNGGDSVVFRFPELPFSRFGGLSLFFSDDADWLRSDAIPSVGTLNRSASKGLSVFDIDEEDFFTFGFNGSIENVTSSSPTPVPEPASVLLLGTGLLGAAAVRRWSRRYPRR